MAGASICGQTKLVDECIGISTSNRSKNERKTYSDVSTDIFIDEVVHVFVKVTRTPKLYVSLGPGNVGHN